MFHHFHDGDLHHPFQGSINKDQFIRLIKFVGRANILNAEDYVYRFINSELSPTDTCLTFDDSLRCQYDIAFPIMEELNIKGFWFIYSSPFFGKPDPLEIFRFFRNFYFSNVDEFYRMFFQHIKSIATASAIEEFFEKKRKMYERKSAIYPFYSSDDIKFRMVRDYFLSNDEYLAIMQAMMADRNFNEKEAVKNLYLNNRHLEVLVEKGHMLGLHSFNHHVTMDLLSYESQKAEYTSNYNHLKNVTGSDIKTMSHPCGRYNNDTKRVLEELNIELGFRESMYLEGEMKIINPGKYEIAREDQSNIIRMMQK